MNCTQKTEDQLAALASHLAGRRAAILQTWRKAVERDPQLTTASSLTRTQFYDHIPDVLDALDRKLRTSSDNPGVALAEEQDAAKHGLQRWQQGYHLREVTREWGHLQLCLVDEVASYALTQGGLEPGVMAGAWRALAELCSVGVSESTAQYFQLQQTEAAGHVQDLEQALAQVQELERQRAELWRQAAHDLRGNLGAVAHATEGLTLEGVPRPVRDNFLRVLQNSVGSLRSLLNDVMTLARLQAGHERRDVKPFDAALLLSELCESLQLLVSERGLFLKAEGPAALPVEGDAVKTRRIAQNLLLNALKYTQQGGVTVSWGDSRKNDPDRWMLCIQDTGPGLHAGPGAPVAGALKEATKEARQVEEKAGEGKAERSSVEFSASSAASDSGPVHQVPGEGIGLSIVKRLCELLDASLELQSEPAKGTIFRVILPRHYDV